MTPGTLAAQTIFDSISGMAGVLALGLIFAGMIIAGVVTEHGHESLRPEQPGEDRDER